MNFAEALEEEERWTETENGAVALNSSGDACLDFFSLIGALRDADENRIETLFAEAYKEDPLLATKIVFYGRDIRNGLGERRVFRILLKYMADHHPESLRKNLYLIGVYGRYDDLYSLIGTKLEVEMWDTMRGQFLRDIANMNNGKEISLLAKWIKTPDASSPKTRQLGILTAEKLGYSVYDFKRRLRAMRKYIDVVERRMSANEWGEINYSHVPSRAMMNYRNAFSRHDEERFSSYIDDVSSGKEKINSSTLYPYDIVQKIIFKEDDEVLEAQWNNLPDYVETGTNALVMADVSGSMEWPNDRPIATSVGLAIYFAEHNVGAYHNIFMTFSANPQIVKLKGETLKQKVNNALEVNWGMNTNLCAAFEEILKIAIDNNVPASEMPESLIVISDMEIDAACSDDEWTFYDMMEDEFKSHGYKIPNIVFWDVESRHNVFHADATRKGVQLVSGQSTTTFKQVIDCIGLTPVETMKKVINSPIYEPITIDLA